MNCSSCGKEIINSDQEFCDGCGTRLVRQQPQTEYQQQTPPVYNPTTVQAVPLQQAPNNTLHIVLAVINIVMICCCNPISLVLGIIALVMAIGAKKETTAEGAKQKLKISLILSIVGLGLMILGSIVSFIFSSIGLLDFSRYFNEFSSF